MRQNAAASTLLPALELQPWIISAGVRFAAGVEPAGMGEGDEGGMATLVQGFARTFQRGDRTRMNTVSACAERGRVLASGHFLIYYSRAGGQSA
ncbi:hypothetical protein JCM14635_38140 [Megalodesulfovibrio paquesii]